MIKVLAVLGGFGLFLAGAISQKLLDPFTDDLYHAVKTRLGKHRLDIVASQTTSNIEVPGGYMQSTPFQTRIKYTFNIVNRSGYDMTVEALDGMLSPKNGDLPPHLQIESMVKPEPSIISGRKTVPAQAVIYINIPRTMNGHVGKTMEDYLNYLNSFPESVLLTVNLKYTHGGKALTALVELDPHILKELAANWLAFLREQTFQNEDLAPLLERIKSRLEELSR